MRPPHLLLAAGCVAALVSGCAVEGGAPLSPAHKAAAFDARSLNDPRLLRFIAGELDRPGAAPSSEAPRWGLAQLTLAALYYHPDLDIARAQLAGAQAAATTARQRPNPTLNLAAAIGTAASPGAIPAGATATTIGPLIELLIETGGKPEYRTERARRLVDAARHDLATASWQVRGRVRDALLDAWAARQRLQLMRRRLEVQDELVGLLQERQTAGAAASLEVSRERLRRAEMALAVRGTESAAVDARSALATAIGIPMAALDGVPLSFAAFERPPALPSDIATGTLRRQALTGRSDIRAALAQYQAAQAALQFAIAERYPNVTLGPGYQYDFGVDKFILGPSLPLPIFNQNQGPIGEAVAARQLAAARFTALQAGIAGALDRATADYRTANAALATADGFVAGAVRRDAATRRAFDAGEIDRPALVAGELEVGAARLAQLDAGVRQRRALGAVEDALRISLFAATPPIPALDASPRSPPEPGA